MLQQKNDKNSYTLDEIAFFFSVNVVTLRKWLTPFVEEIGKPENCIEGVDKYSPRQIEIIKKRLA
jgi:hypothetical protein